jgi:hypothetical protein
MEKADERDHDRLPDEHCSWAMLSGDGEIADKHARLVRQREYLNGEPVTYWLREDQKLGAGQYDNYEIDAMIRRLRTGVPSPGGKAGGDEDGEE